MSAIIRVTVPQKFDSWYKKGIELSMNFIDSMILPEETVYLLCNNTLYALALYTSLQMAEFFGSTAVAHKLEEFCHSPIFGLKKSHHLWILGQNEEQISQRLGKLGLRLSYFQLYNSDMLHYCFNQYFLCRIQISFWAKNMDIQNCNTSR